MEQPTNQKEQNQNKIQNPHPTCLGGLRATKVVIKKINKKYPILVYVYRNKGHLQSIFH